MNVSLNSLNLNSFVNSVAEKGTNVFGQLDRKIYVIAAILFAALVTAALIYQKLKGNNEITIRKRADLTEKATFPEVADPAAIPVINKSDSLIISEDGSIISEDGRSGSQKSNSADPAKEQETSSVESAADPEEVDTTLRLTSSEETPVQGSPSREIDEKMPPFLAGNKNEPVPQKGAVAIDLPQTAPVQACKSLMVQEEANGFPIPFATLKAKGLYNPAELPSIINTVDQALQTPQGERVPVEYAKLQSLVGSDKQLELLYQEAKVLAHVQCVRDLDDYGYLPHEGEYKRQYAKNMFANLSMQVSSLCQHRQFRSLS